MCHLSFTANTMLTGGLAYLGARASAGLVLTPQSQNIPSPASEELSPNLTYDLILSLNSMLKRYDIPNDKTTIFEVISI